LLILLMVFWGASLRGIVIAAPSIVQQQQQKFSPSLDVPFVLPLEATSVTLLTHSADFTFDLPDPSTAAPSFTLHFEGTYRFDNSGAEPVTLILKVTEPSTIALSAELALFADDIPLNLFQTEGVGYTAQLQLAADTRTAVTLRYVIRNLETPLPLLSYAPSVLTAWPGAPSIRVSITVPTSSGPNSWLRVAPDGWHYTQSSRSDLLGIKWLYDAQIPAGPFVFELIHPSQWQQLQQLTADAQNDPALYRQLGASYRVLLDAVPTLVAYDVVRTRFYSQALAAYTTGIDHMVAAGRTGGELGELYAALASLYRTQVADQHGDTNIAYSQAMVNAAQNALTYLPPDESRRSELTQWVVDGLQLSLADAQANNAWPEALALVEQLAALPPELVDHAMLEQTKRSITVRQALELLEAENRQAALTLAGTELTDEALLPAQELQPLFSSWAISATVTPSTIELIVEPLAWPAHREEALAAFETLVASFQRAADSAITLEWLPAAVLSADADRQAYSSPLGRLLLRAPTDGTFASLTTAMPSSPQWVFFYTLLRQLQPTVEQNAAWVNRKTTMRLSLDLQNAASVWQGAAITLEQQAVRLEETAAARNTRDSGEAETALRERIRATNYRTAAQQWRKLVNTSTVQLSLRLPAGLQSAQRAWLITPETPSVMAELANSGSYLSAFISVIAIGLGLLLLISGVLWWLL